MDHLKRHQLISAKSSNNITRRVLHRLGQAGSRHAGGKARSQVFVLAWRFAGLVLIQRKHALVTTRNYRYVATQAISACSLAAGGRSSIRAGRGPVIAALPLIALVARMRAECGCWRISSVPHTKRTAPGAGACCGLLRRQPVDGAARNRRAYCVARGAMTPLS
jgi:hypothetical protein